MEMINNFKNKNYLKFIYFWCWTRVEVKNLDKWWKSSTIYGNAFKHEHTIFISILPKIQKQIFRTFQILYIFFPKICNKKIDILPIFYPG